MAFLEFLHSTELTVPVSQLLLLLLISSLALLFNKPRLALFINYLFTLYWGYILNIKSLFDMEADKLFPIYYFGFGALIGILALIGFLHRGH